MRDNEGCPLYGPIYGYSDFDGGYDSIDNIDVILEHNQSQASKAPVDFIIK